MIAFLMGIPTIAPGAVRRMIEQRAVTVIDVNARERWAQAHVPSARNVDPVTWREQDLPADKDALVVFYCSGPLCRKAPNAARRAAQLGYRNVKVMSAGISGWVGAGLPVDTG